MDRLNYKNFEEFIQKLQQRVHWLMVAPILAFIFLFIRIENGGFHPLAGDHAVFNHLRIIAASVSAIVVALALVQFYVRLNRLRHLTGLRDRLDHYFLATRLKDYLITAILVLNLAGMGFTGDRFYTGLFGLTLVILLMGYPGHSRIMTSLKFNQPELDSILNQEIIE